jgi:2-dehydro-3-deoxyphosphogluconate aldolase/(4S)-4-hydroxy-2-oxoglutarate aldolase
MTKLACPIWYPEAPVPHLVDHGRAARTQALETAGVVAVIRMERSERLRDVIGALAEGGVTAVEVTMTVPNAVQLIAEIAPSLPPGTLLGAGTVLDGPTARQVIDAGAEFVVSPVFRRGVIDVAHAADVPAIPGCFSPTEIADAWDAGADIVKVFPATSLGPAFVKDLRGPLPHVKLMPTGGVSVANAGDWIRAGAVAVGMGTALVNPVHVAERNYAAITEAARAATAAVRHARSSC